MSFNKECPCYEGGTDCPKRHKNCHETCPEFKDWRAELDADNEAKRNDNDSEYWKYAIDKIAKRRKRKNEKHRN